MRVWDVAPRRLCRSHLLGEHRELHALWSVLAHGRKGYRAHPETKRWEGKLSALYDRHEALVREMERRGYAHRSPLDRALATGERSQDVLVNTLAEQQALLSAKSCDCLLPVEGLA